MRTTTVVAFDAAGALVDVALRRASGILTAVRGKLKRLFCFDSGNLVFAVSNVVEEQLSETLVTRGLVSAGDLAAAREEGCDQVAGKLPRALIDRGNLDEDGMRHVVEQHAKDLLFSTLDWTDGEVSLARGRPELRDEYLVRLPCIPLLVEYARNRPASLDEVRDRVEAAGTTLTARPDRGELLGEVDASPALTRLLMQCDGDTTSTLLVSGAPDAEEETWRGLHALLLLGLVEPSRKHRAAREAAQGRAEIEAELLRVENADYYTVLGVPSLAASDQIREAYYVLARRYHPDRFRTGPLEHLREQVEGYFAKVTEAYNTLYDSRLRAMYDAARLADRPKEPAQDRAYLAQENFRRAQDLIAKGRFTDAVTSLENAIQLDGRNASYRLALGRLLSANPRFRKQAEEHLIEANRIDPSLVDGYGALAELYAKSGRRKDAIRVFREVLRWDPDHEEAKRQLRELGSG